jgi:hypothetical protein
MFEHADITLPECNRKNIDGRRMYLTETGEAYPSITTVLSRMSRDGIKAWRERVGAEVQTRFQLKHLVEEQQFTNLQKNILATIPIG